MRKEIINETFSLQIPDSFETLSEADLREMHRKADPFQWGVRDRENHLIILALWKKAPALLAWALDPKSIARKNEQLTAQAHRDHGYRLLDSVSLEAGSESMEGYRFCYRNEAGVSQVCSNFLLRKGRTIYSFMCTGWEENMEKDQLLLRQIMESLDCV